MFLAKKACVIIAFQLLVPYNLLSYSGVTSQQLEKGLKGELKPLSSTFVEIEKEYGINSVLFASIVAMESGWGESDLSKSHNNITSYTTKSGFKKYESKEECLWDMAEHLKENYLSDDGIYYNKSTSIDDVACMYLLGKTKDKMNFIEVEETDNYVETIKGINDSIWEDMKNQI